MTNRVGDRPTPPGDDPEESHGNPYESPTFSREDHESHFAHIEVVAKLRYLLYAHLVVALYTAGWAFVHVHGYYPEWFLHPKLRIVMQATGFLALLSMTFLGTPVALSLLAARNQVVARCQPILISDIALTIFLF